MELRKLAEAIGAPIVTESVPASADIAHVFAGDRISDLLNEASSGTLLVTSLTGPQLLRLAELMDVPGICLVNGKQPDAQIVQAANRQGTVLMVSPLGMFETCGRLHRCLQS
jgi:hypothetical protein